MKRPQNCSKISLNNRKTSLKYAERSVTLTLLESVKHIYVQWTDNACCGVRHVTTLTLATAGEVQNGTKK